jgi:uncharacterized protein DUF6570
MTNFLSCQKTLTCRPSGPDSTAEMTRQFRKRFRVRRRALEIWLEFLANNHPGYREFRLNRTTLNQLPEDGDVFEQLTIHTVEGLDGIPADVGPVDENLALSLIWYFKTQNLPN